MVNYEDFRSPMPEPKMFQKGIGKEGSKTIYDVPAEDITRQDILNLNNLQGGSKMFAKSNDITKTMMLIKAEKIITLEDLENYHYGGLLMGKTVTTATANAVQSIYGRRAWDQVNREHTLFSLLRKVAWSKSGWRVITDEANNDPDYTLEDGSIPAGEDATFDKMVVDPASIAKRTTRSDIYDMKSTLEDGVSVLEIAKWLDKRHLQIINAELLKANEYIQNPNGLWSIDRLLSSTAELLYGNVANSAVITANYLDVYGKDRDATASYLDAQVSGQAWASGDRPLTLSLLNSVLRSIRVKSGRYSPSNMVIVTHPDTAVEIDEICMKNQRYEQLIGETFIRGGRGGMENLGAERRAGVEGAFQVSTWKGIPIFEDPSVVQDTIGRVYFINLDHLFMSVLIPTKYYQWGGPELTASFNEEMMYRTVMNTVCTKFRSQGKLRDLESS